jgi:hypothetical protein
MLGEKFSPVKCPSYDWSEICVQQSICYVSIILSVVVLYILSMELDSLTVSALCVIGLVTKNLFPRASPCFEKRVKPLVPASFAVVAPTNPQWARMVDYGLFFLCVIYKESLCPSSGDFIGWS